MDEQHEEKLRLGVIGSGWIANEMIHGAVSTGCFTVTAVYSRTLQRAQEFAEKHREPQQPVPRCFTDLEEMAVSPDVDAVYIASPNVCHVPQTRLFLQNGKHVLCEKPLAARGQDVIELYRLAEEKDRIYMEAIMMMSLPWLEELRRAVGKIGPVSLAKFDYCQYSSKYDGFLAGKNPNIFNPAMETGALMDLGIYTVYPAVWLFGEPLGITASANFLPGGADGSTAALLQYPDKLVVLTCSKTGQGECGSEIVGEKGTLCIPSVSTLTDMTLCLRGEEKTVLSGKAEKYRLMGYEAEQFARFIRQGPDKTYKQHRKTACQAALLLQQIRRTAGIRFACDGEEQ